MPAPETLSPFFCYGIFDKRSMKKLVARFSPCALVSLLMFLRKKRVGAGIRDSGGHGPGAWEYAVE